MTIFPSDLLQLAENVIHDFSKAKLVLSTAESCTGGLISAILTDIPGSSAVVDRGFVTYTNQAKIDMLGVQPSTLERVGAVSEETAREMAHGAVFYSNADIAVAVTGIAGPGGGSLEKPVGLVHLAAQSRSGQIIHRKMLYGDLGRSQIRLATVKTALEMVIELSQA